MSRRISDRAAEEGHPDRDGRDLQDADSDRGRNEQQGPAIGANYRHLVGPRDEEVAWESVGERRRHDDREKGGCDRRIEALNRERGQRADENDLDDERGVERWREYLQITFTAADARDSAEVS